ncbi:MAG: methyltransferase family protein [Halorhodospira sp.]
MNLHPKSLYKSVVHERHKARQALGILLLVAIVALSAPTLGWLYAAGAVVAAAGITFRLWAAGYLVKDQELAQDGPYALVRHPLYVGNFLIITGFLLAGQVGWLLVIAIAFAILYYPPAIHREDAKLRKRFPEQWEPWYARTSALLPKLRPERPLNVTRWSFRQSLYANGEPIIAALLLLGLFLMGARLG